MKLAYYMFRVSLKVQIKYLDNYLQKLEARKFPSIEFIIIQYCRVSL